MVLSHGRLKDDKYYNPVVSTDWTLTLVAGTAKTLSDMHTMKGKSFDITVILLEFFDGVMTFRVTIAIEIIR